MEQREKYAQKLQQKIHEQAAYLKEHLDDEQAYYTLGEYLVEVKSYSQAEELFLKGLARFKTDAAKRAKLNYGLGNVYYVSEHYDMALACFAQISGSLKSLAVLMQAQCYLAQEKPKLAAAFALTASEQLKNTDKAAAQLVLAQAWVKLGLTNQAISVYQSVIGAKTATRTQVASAYFYWGVALLQQNATKAVVDKKFAQTQKYDQDFYQKAVEKLNAANHLARLQAKKGH